MWDNNLPIWTIGDIGHLSSPDEGCNLWSQDGNRQNWRHKDWSGLLRAPGSCPGRLFRTVQHIGQFSKAMRPSGEQQARKKPYHLLPVTLVHVTFSRHSITPFITLTTDPGDFWGCSTVSKRFRLTSPYSDRTQSFNRKDRTYIVLWNDEKI